MMLCYHNHIKITYYTESSEKVILQADYLGIYLTSFYKILDSLYDRRVEQSCISETIVFIHLIF